MDAAAGEAIGLVCEHTEIRADGCSGGSSAFKIDESDGWVCALCAVKPADDPALYHIIFLSGLWVMGDG